MPGVLVSLSVAAGTDVEAGQEVAVIEAMKMQNVLRAPRAGTVRAVHAVVGSSLRVDQLIATLAPKEATATAALAK
jgi:propionyl-CoA carboxylase alpha chain